MDVSQLVGIVVTTIGIYAVLLVLIRVNGLRSLTKMSSVDFASTVAIGSLIATVILADRPSLLQGAVGLVALFAMQGGFAALRRRVNTSRVENDPVLLMDGGRILEDNLAATRVTRDDLYAKLREANVLNLDQVRAVVLETTGDVSVLHGPADQFDPDLLASVRRDAAILPFRRR
ncbi:DUF421 domain-containing protein [Nitriliruptoria bacterium AS10]|nr:DUF421 domain-containing protein [Salsipaludibacter albus]